ncbi:MAG: hypothetical protein C0507_04585 [Cyanobacteria bacterium PR.3.49]|nr:hypothetical protein [Cyanobacteria bacterium PR.3.49]
MISAARRAWLKDKLHGYLVRKVPNLVRFCQMYERVSKQYREHLLDDNLKREIKVLGEKAQPYLWAYLAGCFAPKHVKHRNEAHSS